MYVMVAAVAIVLGIGATLVGKRVTGALTGTVDLGGGVPPLNPGASGLPGRDAEAPPPGWDSAGFDVPPAPARAVNAALEREAYGERLAKHGFHRWAAQAFDFAVEAALKQEGSRDAIRPLVARLHFKAALSRAEIDDARAAYASLEKATTEGLEREVVESEESPALDYLRENDPNQWRRLTDNLRGGRARP